MSPDLFWLLVGAVGFGVRQLALHLPIPQDVVRRYRQQEATRHRAAVVDLSTEDESADGDPWIRRRDHDEEDFDSWTEPSVNIDGTPMLGDLDAHGNPFGITDDW